MKTTPSLLTLLALVVGASLHAQYPIPVSDPPVYSYPNEAPPALAPQSPEQLDQLLGPIALYPDPLLAILLPASTTPADITLAARLVRANADPASIDAQAWDGSVKAVAHYPELITWMDDNLEWTKQLGAAFLQQPADVMNAVQRLRARARDAGILVDTPQQQVVVESNIIYVEPAQPNVIYVPVYDPDIFYSTAPWPRRSGALSFGFALSMGPWLDYDFDWSRRTVWINRQHDWQRVRDARTIIQTQRAPAPERQVWRPRVDVARRQITTTAPNTTVRTEIVRPAPITQSSPTRTWSRDRNASVAPTRPVTRPINPPISPSSQPTGRTYEPSATATRNYSTEVAPAPTPPSSVTAPVYPPQQETRRLERERDRRTPAAVQALPPPVYNTPAPTPPRDEHLERSHQLPPQAAPQAQAHAPTTVPQGPPQVTPQGTPPPRQDGRFVPPGKAKAEEKKRDAKTQQEEEDEKKRREHDGDR